MARPVLSTTAGILLGAVLVGSAALRLAPEPPVTPAAAFPTAVIPVAVIPLLAQAAAPAPAASTAPAPAPTAVPITPVAVAPIPVAPPLAQIAATPYRSAGRAYAALTAGTGATLDAPLAGRVEVRLYQLVNGEIRTGANVAGLAYFPYVIVRSSDRVFTLRPGAQGVDSEVLVKDGASVTAGTPLVRVTGAGASSWRTFYDRTLEAQIVASLTTAAGADLDALPLFARH